MANKSNDKQMDTGYIYLSRKIMTHPSFIKKPFDEFHALVWLFLNARYSDSNTTQYVGDKLCTWGRGEVPASLRFLEEAFGWPKTNVERWIKKLVDNGTVERRQTQAGTVLRVINYELYQKPGQKPGRKVGQQPGQQNPLPSRDTDEQWDSNRDTNRDSNRDEGGTLVGHSRDKTVIKGVIKEETNEEINVCEQHTHTNFLNIEEEKKYTDAENESFQRFNQLVDTTFPDLRKFQIQISIDNYFEMAKAYNREIIEKILSEINDKPAYHKKHKNLFKTFKLFVENTKSDQLKSKIKNQKAKSNGDGYITGRLNHDEIKGREILRTVFGE